MDQDIIAAYRWHIFHILTFIVYVFFLTKTLLNRYNKGFDHRRWQSFLYGGITLVLFSNFYASVFRVVVSKGTLIIDFSQEDSISLNNYFYFGGAVFNALYILGVLSVVTAMVLKYYAKCPDNTHKNSFIA